MSGRRSDYYPRYYRDKRRRERIILAISVIVPVMLLVGLAVLALVYLLIPRAGLVELAEKEPGLLSSQVEEVAPEAPAQAMPRPEPAQPLVALEDITEYGISVPEVSLIPEGLSGGPMADETPPPQMTEEVATGSEVATPAEEVEQPPQAEESGQSSVSQKKEKPKQEESAAVKKEEEKKPEEKKPKAQPAEPVYTFSVYAGVYDSEVEANRQRDRLIELGFQSTISVRSQGEKKEYALQVGSSLEEYEPAEAVKNRLREAGFPQAIVLRRETR